jgi:hypothetical protein
MIPLSFLCLRLQDSQQRIIERHGLSDGEVLPAGVFIPLRLQELGGLGERLRHEGRDARPAEPLGGFDAPLPGDQPPVGRQHHGLQESESCHALRQSGNIAEVFPVALADLNFRNVDVHALAPSFSVPTKNPAPG